MGPIEVRDATQADETAWRRLWAAYLVFYKTTLSDHLTSRTWNRALEPTSLILARIAERDGEIVGFAMAVLHDGTWVDAPICYLEDLFVDPQARGVGIGRALLDDLVRLGRDRGWSRLYWNTAADNPARRLYDRFTSAERTVRYQLVLPTSSDTATN